MSLLGMVRVCYILTELLVTTQGIAAGCMNTSIRNHVNTAVTAASRHHIQLQLCWIQDTRRDGRWIICIACLNND